MGTQVGRIVYLVATGIGFESLLTIIAPTAEGSWTVEGVVAALPGGPPQTDTTSPVPFFHMLERLKTTKREGWRRFGISQ